eukprot:scaffold6507_cov240-Isochrysis_galbana.AAC.6
MGRRGEEGERRAAPSTPRIRGRQVPGKGSLVGAISICNSRLPRAASRVATSSKPRFFSSSASPSRIRTWNTAHPHPSGPRS